MRIVDSKIVYQGVPGSGTSTISFSSCVALRNSTLLASARIGSGKDTADGNIGIWRSIDGGNTWSGPQIPFRTDWEGKKGCLRAGFLTELPNGVLLITCAWVDRSLEGRLLYNAQTGGLCNMFPIISESHDMGNTWSPLHKVDLYPVTLPSALTGPTLVLQDGGLACQFESQKSWDMQEPVFNISTFKISHDGGIR